ncbi:MAG TPA: hypothetical protein VFK37_00905 [Bacillales bacterium]|nr:hypothetical protein [Bacillales bacterium]
MKKSFAALMAMFVVIFAFIGTASADTAPSDMQKAVNKQLKQGHYDYDAGTLQLTHVKTVHLQKPVDKVSTVVMAIAQYKTVRDQIFFTTHSDAVYYDPDHNKMVPIQTVSKIDAVKKYQDQYKSMLGENVQVTNILILLFFILLIPAYLAFIAVKRKHSVLSYKLENNLFDGTGEKKYS